MNKLPLEGIRVIDFTQVQAGPQATVWLSVMGADVIKIESNKRPDLLRVYFQLRDGKLETNYNKSAPFASLSHTKKSCTLNLRKPKAVDLVKELIKKSDVVVENFSTGVMERLGLGYSTLAMLKKEIIMLSISGFGKEGPEKNHVAYAPVIHAYCGLASLTGYTKGKPETVMGAFWADVIGAQAGAFALLSALHHLKKTGQGQYIDLSMTEATLSTLPEAVMDYTMNNNIRESAGNRDDIMAPHGCYCCKGDDKWVAIAVSSEEEWIAFCNAIGNPAWTTEQKFCDPISRWLNQDELDNLIQEWTKNHKPYEIMKIMQNAGVAAGPSVNIEELSHDPHLEAREFFFEMDHPEMGKGRLACLPGKPVPTPLGNYQPAPLIGEHNDYVLGELLGLSQHEISQLIDEEVVY